jgi:predicted protein tyrosine phosphatase
MPPLTVKPSPEEDDQRDNKDKPQDSVDTAGVVTFALAWNSRNHLCVDCWEGVEFSAASFAKYVRASDNGRSTRAGERGTLRGRQPER